MAVRARGVLQGKAVSDSSVVYNCHGSSGAQEDGLLVENEDVVGD